jgi:hypothetical protein
MKTGYKVRLVFTIVMFNSKSNRILTEKIREEFGGRIHKIGNTKITLHIADINQLIRLRIHFFNYPLRTTKLIHFNVWSKILDLMLNKEHLTLEG